MYTYHCKVVEKIWDFYQPKRVNGDEIAEVILTEVATILQGDKLKVIAQTYDGASTMKRRIVEVHVKTNQVY